MAKVYISTNKEQVKYVININKKAGFESFEEISLPGFSLVVFKKKIHPVDNLYEDNDGNLAIMIGTGFYQGVNGTKALSRVLYDFDGNIEEVLGNMIGNFLLLIYKNDKLYALIDKYNVIDTYYSADNNSWAVSSCLSDLIMARGGLADEEVNYYEFISSTFLISSFSKFTIDKKSFSLQGNEFIKVSKVKGFSINKLKIKKSKWLFSNYLSSDFDEQEIANEYAELIKKYINIIQKNFTDSVGIHQTGGLDNRTVLAAFLNKGIKPRMFYGVGNSRLTNTKAEDLKIVKSYQECFGLELKLMDWSNNLNVIKKQDWHHLFLMQGLLYNIYGGSESFFESYENLSVDCPRFFECGYFLENLRLREFARDIKEPMSIEAFVDEYLLNGAYGIVNNEVIADFSGYRKYIIKEFEEKLKEYRVDLSCGITK